MKINKKLLLLTSAVCLLPLIMSAAVYADLPAQVAIHWNAAGEPDGYASKAVAAFVLPLALLAMHVFSFVVTSSDPKRAGQSNVIRMFFFWLIPVLSLILTPVTLLIALGHSIPIPKLVSIIVGIIFLISGNYLPKTRQNYTIGIKIPWTLHDADNWNKTHRLAGFLWIIAGILFIATAFIPLPSQFMAFVILGTVVAVSVIPIIYSYCLYRKSK